MKRVTSIREVSDINFELPAGAVPYEEFDFEPYFEEARHEEELRKTWRVFTKVKDVLDNGRRLENASWRLWFKERNINNNQRISSLSSKSLSSTSLSTTTTTDNMNTTINMQYSTVATAMTKPKPPKPVFSNSSLSSLDKLESPLDQGIRRAEQETDRIVGDMFGGVGQRFAQESMKHAARLKAERVRSLLELVSKHDLSDSVVDEILSWVHTHVLPIDGTYPMSMPSSSGDDTDPDISSSIPSISKESTTTTTVDETFLPKNVSNARLWLEKIQYTPRPRAAAFSHSLERNGANNLLLYLVRELRDNMVFTLVSPKDGPMRADYEAMGVRVLTCSMRETNYAENVRKLIDANSFQYVIANTIMTTQVVRACKALSVPCLFLIHEAWPSDQLDYYARDVFLMPPHVIDGSSIKDAFSSANKVVFPAHVQRKCYEGLFSNENARVIYNGIPLASINAFRSTKNRTQVRAELGWTDDDFVLVQLGTVCKRKGQLVTCEAFAQLRETYSNLKLMLVGARYIRQHEIDYIAECKSTLDSVNAFPDAAQILDVKKNVLPYYMAADVILVPSFNEVLPLVICEAMAFERPVIASSIDGIPEAISHEAEGFLMEAGNVKQLVDYIETLYRDEDLRKRMGAAGRKRVLSQFSFETMSEAYRKAIGQDLDMDLSKPSGAVAAEEI